MTESGFEGIFGSSGFGLIGRYVSEVQITSEEGRMTRMITWWKFLQLYILC